MLDIEMAFPTDFSAGLKRRLLAKAAAYTDSLELFLRERDKATPILISALDFASTTLKRNIILLLGGFARDQAPDYLLPIVLNADEALETRRLAALILSAISPGHQNRQRFVRLLIDKLNSSDSDLRINAALALGWDHNSMAVKPLFDLLDDPDLRVRQSAIIALSNVNYARAPQLMLQGLQRGTLNQKRIILANLWRFFRKKSELVPIYLTYLRHADAQMRLQALSCLSGVGEATLFFVICRKCLRHFDPQIRVHALRRLYEEHGEKMPQLIDEIERLCRDNSLDVQRTARNLREKLLASN